MVRARVLSVNISSDHRFSKAPVERADVVTGVGIRGDCHAGGQVQHRSRVAADPSQPNLRQVHLIGAELFDRVAAHGHIVRAGDLGENLTTADIDLHALPTGTVLLVGEAVLLGLTGLRNPCGQINQWSAGLQHHLIGHDGNGRAVLLGGVMAVVLQGGTVLPGARIDVSEPPGQGTPLVRV